MYVALVIVHIIVSISLVLIVLLQQGRGAELGAAFGGLGQTTYGRGEYTFVAKVTTALAVVFMVTSLSLAFISTERPRSSILSPADSRPAAAEQQLPASAPTPAPATQQPTAPATPTLPQQAAPPAGGSSPASK
ncbi:MAG TPA: preprotein translocase subunit SecG [bacterium]|nr:preprotein translocase subunit SecG [bacterium]